MKQISFILISLLFCLLIQAQTPTKNLPVVSIPATPEVAALSVKGAYSTGKFSGSMVYDLPIYTLKLPGLEIPIGLHYQSNGVKVDEIASRVGLDWSLEAGGVISRTIMNYPDELKYYFAPPAIPITTPNNAWLTYIYTTLTNHSNDIPDVFSFSFLNYSGKFYLTPDLQNVIMVPYQNITIIPVFGTSGNQIVSFTIKTFDGNTFVFSTQGSTAYVVQGNASGASDPRLNQNGVTSWHLSKINTAYKDSITFQYNTNYSYGYNQAISQSAYGQYTNWNGQVPGISTYPMIVQAFTTSYQNFTATEPLLKKILTSRSDSIVFTDDPAPRTDISATANNAPHKLSSIDIYNGIDTTPIKHVDFGLSYTTSTDNDYVAQTMKDYGTFPGCLNRLFLDNVTFDKQETYSFSYDRRTLLPRVTSYAKDPWGYFDGNITKSSLISVGASFTTDLSLSGLSNTPQIPNPTYTTVGILNTITYPTGGSRHIEYEQNGDATTVIGGCRVLRTYETDVNNDTINKIRYFYNTYQLRNTPLYTCNSQPIFQQSFSDTYVAPEGGEASINGNPVMPDGYFFKPGCTRNQYSSGLLSTSQCDGNPCFYPVVTESYGDNFQNGGKESHFTGGCDEAPTFVNIGSTIIPAINWLFILSATHPERNELNDEQYFMVNSSTKQIIKELKYTYGFDESKTQTIYGFALDRLYSIINCFTYIPNQVPAYTYQDFFKTYCQDPLCAIYTLEAENQGAWLDQTVGRFENYLQLYRYSILSKCIQLQQVVERDSLTGGIVTKTTNYSYNPSNLILSKQEIVDNGTKVLQETYKYSNEYSSGGDSILTTLSQINANNMIVPVEVTNWCNNKVIGSQLSKFNSQRGCYFLPSEKLSLKIKTPVSNFVQSGSSGNTFSFDTRYTTDLYIDAYDTNGNILQYHSPDNVYFSFLWGYHNRLPVVKVENTDRGTLNTKVLGLLGGYSNLDGLLMSGTSNWVTFNQNLRNNLAVNSQATTYTYKSQVGMMSATDTRGVTTNFTYDTSNRLYLARNDDKNILARYSYGYRNAPDNGLGGYTALAATLNTGASSYFATPSTVGTATINVSGGSGSYSYSWYLENSTGGVVWSVLNTAATSFSFPCQQAGILTIQCVITDTQTGEIINSSKNITCYFLLFTVNPNAYSYNYGATGTATCGSVSGGSGSYNYSWYLMNSSGTVLANTLNTSSTSFSFTCLQTGALTVQCTVNDNNVSGKTTTVSSNITCNAVALTGNLSMQSGYNNAYNTISSNGTVVTFVMSFSNTNQMTAGTNYFVARVPSGCQPSVTRVISYVTGGRTWNVTFNPDMTVYCQIVSGTNLPAGGGMGISSTYNL